MKINENLKKLTVTQRAFANAVGLTPARVNVLVKEGVVVKDESDFNGGVFLIESLKNYWQRGNKQEDDIDFNLEKAKHEKVKRELTELKLSQEQAKLYDANTVELVMIEMLANLRTQLLGLPSKLAPLLEGHGKEDIFSILTREITEKLSELSEYSPSIFMEEVESNVDVEEE